MMIKRLNAFIACSAMLTTLVNTHAAYLTIVFVFFILKTLVHSVAFFLDCNQAVFGVYNCRPDSIVNYKDDGYSADYGTDEGKNVCLLVEEGRDFTW